MATATPFPVSQAQASYARTSTCINCDDATPYAFTFDRRAAADAALSLCRFAPQNPFLYPDGPTHNFPTTFMSFAYYAGGIPMVTRRTAQPPLEPGWFAQEDGQ